jgi:hypothetical protein
MERKPCRLPMRRPDLGVYPPTMPALPCALAAALHPVALTQLCANTHIHNRTVARECMPDGCRAAAPVPAAAPRQLSGHQSSPWRPRSPGSGQSSLYSMLHMLYRDASASSRHRAAGWHRGCLCLAGPVLVDASAASCALPGTTVATCTMAAPRRASPSAVMALLHPAPAL